MSNNILKNNEDYNQNVSFDAAPEPQILDTTIQHIQSNHDRFPDADDDPSLQYPYLDQSGLTPDNYKEPN